MLTHNASGSTILILKLDLETLEGVRLGVSRGKCFGRLALCNFSGEKGGERWCIEGVPGNGMK